MVKKMVKYNPAFLSADELVEAFVVRHAELELIVEVVRENVGESNQHMLVIGPRGIGKTMLALRVAEEVRRAEDLKGRWYPLVFAEESYQVTSPGEFWLEALFHLAQQTKEERWKKTYEELKREGDETRLRERALAQLMDFADEVGRRIMLVVENFNMLAGDLIGDDDAWVLRHTLQNESRIMLLATATSRFEEVENSGKAMFDLFRPMELEPLGTKDCGKLWHAITGKAVSDKRVTPLKILTGGSPRLMRIVSEFAGRMSLRALIDDLMQLVDENTEYFRSHLEYLPATERKVYLALAEIWDPATAKQVADAARVGVSKASSLLGRLVERGAVVTADGEGRKKQYQVAERMYNIYYLMRRRGAPSNRIRAVVNFMVSFYGEEELATVAARIAEEACGLAAEMRMDHYCAYEGILERTVSPETRYKLVEITPKGFFDMADTPSSIRCLVEPEGRERDALELLAKAGAARESGKTAGDAEKLCRKAIEIAPDSAEVWVRFGLFLYERERCAESEEAYRKAIELKDGKYAWAWAHLGQLLHEKLERYDEAEEAYRKAIKLDKKLTGAWAGLGLLLHEKLERYDEAEKAYRKVIELEDGKNAWVWAHLGQLLHEKLERYDEAGKAYQKVIELEPEVAWGHAKIGQLLHEKLERYDEAEKAYRKAIELKNGKYAWAWVALGLLLHEKLERYDEAEKAYRKAIELKDGKYAWAWAHLGQLLHEKLERYDEAEEAYRKAIKLDKNSAWAWARLGLLLYEKLSRYEEAEEAYRKAIELDEKFAGAWAGLGLLLHNKLERYEEAEQAYRKAIELNEKFAGAWTGLGLLLHDKLERYEEAEVAYRKAIELEPGASGAVWGLVSLLMEELGRAEEGLGQLKQYLEETEKIEEDVDGAIGVVVELAGAGYAQEVLKIVQGSASAEILEPLVVGLRMYLGEDVKVAAEIMEIGKDVVARIEERRKNLGAERD